GFAQILFAAGVAIQFADQNLFVFAGKAVFTLQGVYIGGTVLLNDHQLSTGLTFGLFEGFLNIEVFGFGFGVGADLVLAIPKSCVVGSNFAKVRHSDLSCE